MAEPGLALGYPEIRRALGRFLGYGSDPDDWTATQVQEVADHIASGLRRFYSAYNWSFLSPVYSITTVIDQADYDLPYNFLTILDRITFAPTNAAWWSVPVVPDAQIRRLRMEDNSSNTPRMASVIPVASDGTTGMRHTLSLYPTPNAVVALSFRMLVQPDSIDATHPYPLGGTQHAESILESCLAAAESTMDDVADVHDQRAKELLAQSIRTDRALSPVQSLGYNGDASTEFDSRMQDRRRRVILSINT